MMSAQTYRGATGTGAAPGSVGYLAAASTGTPAAPAAAAAAAAVAAATAMPYSGMPPDAAMQARALAALQAQLEASYVGSHGTGAAEAAYAALAAAGAAGMAPPVAAAPPMHDAYAFPPLGGEAAPAHLPPPLARAAALRLPSATAPPFMPASALAAATQATAAQILELQRQLAAAQSSLTPPNQPSSPALTAAPSVGLPSLSSLMSWSTVETPALSSAAAPWVSAGAAAEPVAAIGAIGTSPRLAGLSTSASIVPPSLQPGVGVSRLPPGLVSAPPTGPAVGAAAGPALLAAAAPALVHANVPLWPLSDTAAAGAWGGSAGGNGAVGSASGVGGGVHSGVSSPPSPPSIFGRMTSATMGASVDDDDDSAVVDSAASLALGGADDAFSLLYGSAVAAGAAEGVGVVGAGPPQPRTPGASAWALSSDLDDSAFASPAAAAASAPALVPVVPTHMMQRVTEVGPPPPAAVSGVASPADALLRRLAAMEERLAASLSRAEEAERARAEDAAASERRVRALQTRLRDATGRFADGGTSADDEEVLPT